MTDGGSGYVHAPVVRIPGGTGTGATAVASISEGIVTGITITNPGTGYGADDVLVVSIDGGRLRLRRPLEILSSRHNTTGLTTNREWRAHTLRSEYLRRCDDRFSRDLAARRDRLDQRHHWHYD